MSSRPRRTRKIGQEFRAEAKEFAKANGLMAMTLPKELGGGGLSFLEQAVVNEQGGRATNGQGWCYTSPPRFLVEVASSAHQMATWVKPLIDNTRGYAYAITEEGAGSDVDAIEATAAAKGNGYVLNGLKWHATGGASGDFFIFQAKFADGPHAGRTRAVLRRQGDRRRDASSRAQIHAHTQRCTRSSTSRTSSCLRKT